MPAARESHHTVLLSNDRVVVLKLHLAPGEKTRLHRHTTFYGFLSLTPATISNEVPTHKPVVSELAAGEVHTSKGGFELVEHNLSPDPVDIIVFEVLPSDRPVFNDSMGGFHYQGLLFGNVFESDGVRAYELKMGEHGEVAPHVENHDRLIVALTDLELMDGGDSIQLKQGDVRWFPARGEHAMTNASGQAARLLVIEFK